MKHKMNGGFLQWSIDQGNATVAPVKVLTSDDRWHIAATGLCICLFLVMVYALR